MRVLKQLANSTPRERKIYKQAEAKLGQAQLKLGLNLTRIGWVDLVLLVRLNRFGSVHLVRFISYIDILDRFDYVDSVL